MANFAQHDRHIIKPISPENRDSDFACSGVVPKSKSTMPFEYLLSYQFVINSIVSGSIIENLRNT